VLISVIVSVDVPALANLKEIVEPETHGHAALCEHVREEAAAEYDHVGIGYSEHCAVEQDEVAERAVDVDVLPNSRRMASVSGQVEW
jgi:hypothetical protein